MPPVPLTLVGETWATSWEFFMAIELTPEEQARLNQANQRNKALQEWQANLATNLAQEKIRKSGATNPATLKKIKQNAGRKATNLVKAVDKGFMF